MPQDNSKKTSKKKTSKKKTTKKAKLKVVAGGKKTKKKAFDETAFYKKYPWVVKGSVKEVKPGTKVSGIVAAHGRICQIKCQETGELRTINVQDAFQTKYTEEVQKRKARERAAERRRKAAKSSKRKSS